MTLSKLIATTQTITCVYGWLNPWLITCCCKRIQYDQYILYGKGRRCCVPKKYLIAHRVLPASWYHVLCCNICSPIPVIFILLWVVIVIFNFFVGILFRIIDVPIAIFNILTCYWAHNWKCDISPIAGENYFEYLFCCSISLIVNAFMPADLEACFDSSEACCDLLATLCETTAEMGDDEPSALDVLGEVLEEALEDDYDKVKKKARKKSSRVRKCETEKVSKYFKKYHVVHQDPCRDCPGKAKQENNGWCCEICVDEDFLYYLSENRKHDEAEAKREKKKLSARNSIIQV